MSSGSYEKAVKLLQEAAKLLDLRLHTLADTYKDNRDERFSGFLLTTKYFDRETMEIYMDKIITPLYSEKKETADVGFSEPS